jgi:hypothetical protein
LQQLKEHYKIHTDIKDISATCFGTSVTPSGKTTGLKPIANDKLFLQGSTSFAPACYVSKVQFVEGFKNYVQSMIKILIL